MNKKIKVLGSWETIHNPNFNRVGFNTVRIWVDNFKYGENATIKEG